MLDAVGEATGEDEPAVAARREPSDVGHQRLCQRTWGGEPAEGPRRREADAGEGPVRRRASRKAVGDEAEMGEGLPRLEPPGGASIPGVDLGQAQLGRDGDVCRPWGSTASDEASGASPVDAHLEIGAEQPEPRPFAEQRGQRAVVADRLAMPGSGPRDGAMASLVSSR